MADSVAIGHAVGKVILCGEHAVVYGFPAIAAGIDRGTTVRLTQHTGPVQVHSASGDDDRLLQAVRHVTGATGWRVDIDSTLPIGRGMGSSAALSVALVRAWAQASGDSLAADVEHRRCLEVETVFHGTPSGIDNAVAAQGGVLRFRKTDHGPVWTPVSAPPLDLVVLDSGVVGDTKALVAGVRDRHPGNGALLEAIGALADPVQEALGDIHALGPLFLRNHALLASLGVSTPALDALVDFAVAAGATGAKLAGAGGGGIVIAVTARPTELVHAAIAQGIPAFHTVIHREMP